MSNRIRKSLFIFFLFLFAAITPVVLLYAVGYKFNLSWPPKFNLILQKTGMLILDTEPRGAKIYLNGKLQKNVFDQKLFHKSGNLVTPAKLKNLLPGMYDVRVELDGHWTWEKRLEVQPGKSSFAEHITLFRKDQPIRLTDDRVGSAEISNNNEKLAFYSAKGLNVLNLENESIISASTSDSGDLSATPLWSPRDRRILLGSTVFSSDLASGMINLKIIIGNDAQKILWSSNDDDEIFYLHNNTINSYNLKNQTNRMLIAVPAIQPAAAAGTLKMLDFMIAGNEMYILTQEDDLSRLIKWSLPAGRIEAEYDLAKSDAYLFQGNDGSYIFVQDHIRNTYYIFDNELGKESLVKNIPGWRKSIWMEDGRLLFFTDYEVFIYDPEKKEEKILTRISDRLNSLVVHPSNNYILFSTASSMYSLELDNREKYNITELLKFNRIDGFYLSPKGSSAYILGNDNSIDGIYRLPL